MKEASQSLLVGNTTLVYLAFIVYSMFKLFKKLCYFVAHWWHNSKHWESLKYIKIYLPAIALICSKSTWLVLPDSRSDSCSPIQATTHIPSANACPTFSPVNYKIDKHTVCPAIYSCAVPKKSSFFTLLCYCGKMWGSTRPSSLINNS